MDSRKSPRLSGRPARHGQIDLSVDQPGAAAENAAGPPLRTSGAHFRIRISGTDTTPCQTPPCKAHRSGCSERSSFAFRARSAGDPGGHTTATDRETRQRRAHSKSQRRSGDRTSPAIMPARSARAKRRIARGKRNVPCARFAAQKTTRGNVAIPPRVCLSSRVEVMGARKLRPSRRPWWRWHR
jgi:hypothetical protein